MPAISATKCCLQAGNPGQCKIQKSVLEDCDVSTSLAGMIKNRTNSIIVLKSSHSSGSE